MSRISTRAALAVGAAIVTGAFTSAALAAIPDDQGVITGCYNSTSGALRVIDAGKVKCSSSERALTWNQKGQQGPAGPAGPAGAQGPAGPVGNQGVPGVSGYEFRESYEVEVGAGVALAHWLTCPDGKVATGGGFMTSSYDISVGKNGPLMNSDHTAATGWEISLRNNSQETVRLHVYAICANAS